IRLERFFLTILYSPIKPLASSEISRKTHPAFKGKTLLRASARGRLVLKRDCRVQSSKIGEKMNMKSWILGLATVLASLIACAQQTGGGGAAAPSGQAPATGVPVPAVPPGTTVPPAQQRQNPAQQPGANNAQQLPPGLVPPANPGVGVVD